MDRHRHGAADGLPALLEEVRACTLCAPYLPFPPRPVLQAGSSARLLIVSQAPGLRVQQTGIPWNDPSGKRLREWLQLSPECFYDPRHVALLPMAFCYPGRGANGDLPPRPECAAEWHERLLAAMPAVRLTLLVGGYAQAHVLANRRRATLTETVRAFAHYLPEAFPLPHPSPRNQAWWKRNIWFENETLPELRRRVADALPDCTRPSRC